MARTKSFELNKHWTVRFLQDNNKAIRYAIYKKKEEVKAKTYLIFLNGRTEFIEKYNFLPEELELQEDVHLITLDHRGQGSSSGLPGHINSYEQYTEDLEKIIALEIKDKPYLILAHSMGSLITLFGTAQGKLKPKSIFLCSPFLGTPLSTISSILIFYASKLIKFLQLGEASWPKKEKERTFLTDEHTDSQEMFERSLSSPYSNTNISFAWIAASFSAIKFVHKKYQFNQLPETIECIQATKDEVVCNNTFLKWVINMNRYHPKSQVNLHFLKTKHEVLLAKEDTYNKAIKIIKLWLSKHI